MTLHVLVVHFIPLHVFSAPAVKLLKYKIDNVYPHDPEAFTQGLFFENGIIYESTGLWGQSTLRRVPIKTGDPIKIVSLDPRYFGEGLTILNDLIYQLTWRSRVGFIYNKHNLKRIDTFYVKTDGWGLTHDGKQLILSDGTQILHLIDPVTFERRGHIPVFDENGPVTHINELEFIDGKIFANIWHKLYIVIIEPDTGSVSARLDLTGLYESEAKTTPPGVLNGIAYDTVKKHLFITGKRWRFMFEIKLLPDTIP